MRRKIVSMDQQKSILFVQGTGTMGYGVYNTMVQFFHLASAKVHYFMHKDDDDLSTVKACFKNCVKNNRFDCVVGHSTGCFLIVDHIRTHGNIGDHCKIVLIAPFVYISQNDIYKRLLLLTPETLAIPRMMILPPQSMKLNVSLYDYLNPSNLSLMPVKLVKQILDQVLMNYIKYIDTININKMHVIYGTHDTLAPIEEIAGKLLYAKSVFGSHEPFNDDATISWNFFKILKESVFPENG
jgi:hypothetical protein